MNQPKKRNPVRRVLRYVQWMVIIVTALIVIPAAVFGTLQRWEILTLACMYFIFILFPLLPAMRGRTSKSRETPDVARRFGWRAYSVYGIYAAHWLAVADFSKGLSLNNQPSLANALNGVLPETWLTVAGLFLIALGALIVWSAVDTLGEFFDRLIIKEQHQLVTARLYGVVRHPVYLAFILLYLGICLTMQSLWALALMSVCSVPWFGAHIDIEEDLLSARFGAEFERYKSRTKKLIPFLY